VDVVATAQYTSRGLARSTSRVVLRNLLVLEAPDQKDAGSGEETSATLVMNDRQTQTMAWAMKNSTWFLTLRPTARPRNSRTSLETLKTFLGRGLPPSEAAKRIAGNFPESVRGQ
jgi:Flp pilus assembly protein CpaB